MSLHSEKELFLLPEKLIHFDSGVHTKIIRVRLPNFSMVKMAIQDAIQYSVPLHAANRRLRKGDRPMFCSNIVAA
jgi:hypothetical protein